ncbi:esterase FE4-like isoform X2 [Daktulosphaira vitifoliae]|uniref:esterase FE4-like isoform X2 n=1 Tax=Daktulosphaira vitifoliae TaxID=58002 RepID=UPI0021AA179F|nr:esterase FE4-like isoform X2 [Daktulosphaira vitifoliae]
MRLHGVVRAPSGYCVPIVQVKNGLLQGEIKKSKANLPYYSFSGIPFAKPPVGELRFKAPQPLDFWNGTLDATKLPKKCIQLTNSNEIDGEEDCLYLNVYTPNLKKKLPVMFWIYPGAFHKGYSGFTSYGPEYFMDKEIILVTSNHRLGILGFLSTEDDVIRGNFGLKDQVMALHWVQENIQQFGGDPRQVTIAGASSGGASVGYHLLSPLSKGLFHKGILQGGTPLCRRAISFPGLARKRAKNLAILAGCKINSSFDILKCLKPMNASVITKFYSNFFKWKNHPRVVFPPVIEKCDSDAFICHNPLIDFKQESYVPVIIGLNSAEGCLYSSSIFNTTKLLHPELYTDFNHIVPILLTYKNYTSEDDLPNVSKQIFNRYYPSGFIDDQSYLNTQNMIKDGYYLQCIMEMAIKLTSPVYFYLFDYQNEFSLNRNSTDSCLKPIGPSHGEETYNLFIKIPKLTLNEKDTEVSKTMVNIWTQFISTDYPTTNGTSEGLKWPEFMSNESSLLLHVDSAQPKLIPNPFTEIYTFWQGLPLLSGLKDTCEIQ